MRASPGPDYEAVFDETPAPLLLMTPDLVIVRANRARLEATCTTLEATVGKHLFDIFPGNPDDPAADGVRNLRASLAQARETRLPQTMAIQKYDIPLPDGTYEERFWSPRNVPILDDDGEVAFLLHRADDITEYVRHREPTGRESARESRWRHRVEEVEADLLRRTRELTELNLQLREARDALALQALHDPLTGLLVRSVLLDRLAHSLSRLDRHPGGVAVLFVDLDGLKDVNDTHGHAAGDTLITSAARRLRSAVRPSDAVARFGGDEFVVVTDELGSGDATALAGAVAERLLAALGEPCTVAPGVVVQPSASIGIAVADSSGPTGVVDPAATGGGRQHAGAAGRPSADRLVSWADSAMYDAKRAGRRRYRVYTPTGSEAPRERRTAG
ncbi:diguanylate cyclase domain-containing protein [Cellulomonas cellasea]|uniref:Protein phosphatase n=2 Tax=Cellulomonas cellasea TaxID=43670 RepID=A0A0A0BCD1_9CELL|nr:diguanylate cyclase [Cellulomonas cellasea]KGM03519.1 protein phosphatase [Cellulomonas cellasea DSM 20118]GEA87150.1 hypothetical protein CCE01nite_10990 [Cellulomonas cellasea]